MGMPPLTFGDGPSSGPVPRNKRRQRVLYRGCTIPEPPVDYAHLQRVLNGLVSRLDALEERGLGRSPSARYLREEIVSIRRKLR